MSPVLGWGSEVSCPRILPRKNPEDPVRLEPRTPGLQVEHFTTEPRGTILNLPDPVAQSVSYKTCGQGGRWFNTRLGSFLSEI